jgi:uncharacterized protein
MPGGRSQEQSSGGRKWVFFSHGNNELGMESFDSGKARTYYTRPMPADWSRPVDVDRLADAGEVREFDVDLSEFPRLEDQLAQAGGRARGSLSVARERGIPVVEVAVQADIPLVCQRCLGIVELPVESAARVAIVKDLASADALDADLDPFIAADGRLALRDLAEEQLLLALPLVPRHEDDAQCDAAGAAALAAEAARAQAQADAGLTEQRREGAAVAPEESAAQVTQKPFAELGELLKRSR